MNSHQDEPTAQKEKEINSKRKNLEQKNSGKDGDKDIWFVALFVFLGLVFIGSASLYAWLHFRFRESASVYPLTEAAQTRVLGKIQAIEDTLGSPGILDDGIDNSLEDQSGISPGTISVIKGNLDEIEENIRFIPWIATDSVALVNLQRFIEAEEQPFDRGQLQSILSDLRTEVHKGGDIYFWSIGYWRLLEYFFWGLFGTLIYLLQNLSSNRRRYDVKKEPFKKYWHWYIQNLLRGPFIVFVLLMGLSTIEIQLVGVRFGLNSSPIELVIFLSAALGAYSRTAKEQFSILVEKIFPEAWARSEGRFTIGHKIVRPEDVEDFGEPLPYGNTVIQFMTEPENVDVTWSIEGANEDNKLGHIGSRDGLYHAPSSNQEEDLKTKMVTIKAESDRRPGYSNTISFVLEVRPATNSSREHASQMNTSGRISAFQVEFNESEKS